MGIVYRALDTKLDPSFLQAKCILAICGTMNSSEPRWYYDLAQYLGQDPNQPEAALQFPSWDGIIPSFAEVRL